MRAHGVVDAEWSSTGELLRCVLSPYQPGVLEPERELTDEEKRAAAEVAARMIDRLTFGAS